MKRSKLKPTCDPGMSLCSLLFEIDGVSDKNSALLVLDATITKVNQSTRRHSFAMSVVVFSGDCVCLLGRRDCLRRSIAR